MKTYVIGRESRQLLSNLNSSEFFFFVFSKLVWDTTDDLCWLVFQGTYVEGIKEEVVLSPGHALSFIAAGEGLCQQW